MITFATDENNDLMLDNLNNIKLVHGIEAYQQDLLDSLRTQQFEYPYDSELGINYLGYVMGRAPNLAAWEAQILDLVNNKSYVKKINQWAYKLNKNNLEFILKIETELGEIEIKG